MRCWVNANPAKALGDGVVVAWYLLDDGSWVYLRKGELTVASLSSKHDHFLSGLVHGWHEVLFPPTSR